MSLSCPRCLDISLEEIELEGIPIDRCPRCAGLWFDNSEVGELTKLKNRLNVFESIVPPSSFGEQAAHCPRCTGVPLRQMRFGVSGREALLYRCASCLGTWVDRGEFREIEDKNLVNTLTEFFAQIPQMSLKRD